MDTTMVSVKKAYDKAVLEEYERLNSLEGNAEFKKVIEAIHQYISPKSTIYDIGCGPGKYVEYLLKENYKVGCLDISKKSIQFLNEKIKNLRKNLLFSEVGCACDIELLGLGKADAMLLLGPMYHLINPNSRNKALKNCHQVLKEDGILMTMFLNSLPLLGKDHRILDFEKKENHIVTWAEYKGEKIPQYRCTPQQAVREFQDYFHVLEVVPINDSGCYYSNQDVETFAEQYFVISKKKI